MNSEITLILNEFIKIIKHSYPSKLTIYNYLKNIEQFILYLEIQNKEDFEKINNKQINKWLLFLKDKNQNNTINRKIAAVKKFYLLLNFKNEYIENIRYLRYDNKLVVSFQKSNILNVINNQDLFSSIEWKWKRDSFLMKFLYSTGLRISECLNIKISDIFFAKKKVTIKSKGGDEDSIYLLDTILQEMQDLIKIYPFEVREEDFLFLMGLKKKMNPRYVQRLCQKISNHDIHLKDLTPHKLRHSIATEMLDSGIKINTIQKFLRHKNISNTARYTQVSNKDIQKVLNKINPQSLRNT